MDERVNVISIKRFNRPVETIDVNVLLEGGHNHGGGDNGLIEEFYKVLCGEEDAPTRLEDSVESHLMAIRAEESRRKGGALLSVHAEKR